MSAAAITLGTGKDKPQGKAAKLVAPYPDSLYEILAAQPRIVERWWSPHTWKHDRRNGEQWLCSIGVAVDLDWADKDKTAYPPAALAAKLQNAARGGLLPGACCHTTPHGLRVIFCYSEPNTDRELQVQASKGAGAMVADAMRQLGIAIYAAEEPGATGYMVDKATWDLARLFYTHSCEAKGVKRTDELILMNQAPSDPRLLAMSAPAEPEPVAAPPRAPAPTPTPSAPRVVDFEGTIQQRIDRWVADHSPAYPERELGTCPACGHNECFKQLPGDRLRWFCFSTSHSDVGMQSAGGWHGDAMDLEMFATRMTRAEILRRDGYLGPAREYRPAPPPDGEAPVATLPAPADRMLSNGSLDAVVTILRKNERDVLRGRKLEYNTLAGQSELGRVAIEDVNVTDARHRIERLFPGGVDKAGNQRGMKQSKSDVADAIDLVARESSYNPLQQYLEGLTWDGVPRIDAVAEDILGAERTTINLAIVRSFFLSAISRAMNPGCKVDEMFILVGKKGARKSTFFKVLGGEWFSDTPVDIKDKDSYQMMRGSWIYEWAELEALNRARDAAAARGFLSSPVDRYRPPYGRFVVSVPRSNVIVGTTNTRDFLVDETGEGERRYLPMVVGDRIDIATLEKWRDNLWAEALVAHRAGEQRFLSDQQAVDLRLAQRGFEHADEWTTAVLDMDFVGNKYTIADVLRIAIEKPKERWSKADANRIATILRQAGFESYRGSGGARFWKPVGK